MLRWLRRKTSTDSCNWFPDCKGWRWDDPTPRCAPEKARRVNNAVKPSKNTRQGNRHQSNKSGAVAVLWIGQWKSGKDQKTVHWQLPGAVAVKLESPDKERWNNVTNKSDLKQEQEDRNEQTLQTRNTHFWEECSYLAFCMLLIKMCRLVKDDEQKWQSRNGPLQEENRSDRDTRDDKRPLYWAFTWVKEEGGCAGLKVRRNGVI